MIDSLRAQGETVVLVDAGGFVGVEPGTRDARSLFLLQVMRDLRYAGVNLGLRDLELGDDLIRSLARENPDPLISANLSDPQTGKLLFPPFRVVDAGGSRVGIIGVMKPRPRANPGPPSEFEILDIEESIASAVREMGEVDFVVLLTDLPEKQARLLVDRLSEPPEVAVLAGMAYNGYPSHEDVGGHDTFFALGGVKGLNVALTRVRHRRGEILETGFDLVALGPRMPQNEDTARLVDEFVQTLNDLLRAEALSNVTERRKSDDGEFFLGVQSCRGCHQREYEIWQETPHAHAFRTLVDAGSDALPECYQCHVTGAGDPSGYAPEYTDAAELQDVQCEVCHDRGTAHSRDGTYGEGLGMNACARCHDEANSPLFDPEVYWLMMEH